MLHKTTNYDYNSFSYAIYNKSIVIEHFLLIDYKLTKVTIFQIWYDPEPQNLIRNRLLNYDCELEDFTWQHTKTWNEFISSWEKYYFVSSFPFLPTHLKDNHEQNRSIFRILPYTEQAHPYRKKWLRQARSISHKLTHGFDLALLISALSRGAR